MMNDNVWASFDDMWTNFAWNRSWTLMRKTKARHENLNYSSKKPTEKQCRINPICFVMIILNVSIRGKGQLEHTVFAPSGTYYLISTKTRTQVIYFNHNLYSSTQSLDPNWLRALHEPTDWSLARLYCYNSSTTATASLHCHHTYCFYSNIEI